MDSMMPRGAFAKRKRKRKGCRFCEWKMKLIDYKDTDRIKGFLTDQGKILGSRTTGTCRKHQRKLTNAVKRARRIALLPYVGKMVD